MARILLLFLLIFEAHGWEQRVYLASYPRSGNHWVRYLIEEATGIATSSVYRDADPMHLPQVFPWGGYCCNGGYEGHCRYPAAGETVVIKTHFPASDATAHDLRPRQAVVRLVRHPVDSFYSHYLCNCSYFGFRPKEIIPNGEVKRLTRMWIRFQKYWNEQENVLTIRYEDLCQDPHECLHQILNHIGYPILPKRIEKAVATYPAKGAPLKHYHHYSSDSLAFIRLKLEHFLKLYGYEMDPPPAALRSLCTDP